MNVILASTSPRRQMLLNRLAITFDIIPPNVDESIVIPEGNPETYCISLAKLKANDISQHYPGHYIIAADTTVVIDDEFLGKPIDKHIAQKMLEKLSNKTHQVYTGVVIQCIDKNISHSFAELTSVEFRNLNINDITYYIQNYHPYDKAGSYGVQDWSSIFVKEIRGCYDNVVGFPLSRFYHEIKKLNINLLDVNS